MSNILSVEVSAYLYETADHIQTCNDQPHRAAGFAVYIRNPLAFHVHDFEVPADRRGLHLAGRIARAKARRLAFDYADELAEHLGCEVSSVLLRPNDFVIEPQRDSYRGLPEGDEGETCFVPCSTEDAEIFAVFDTRGADRGDAELVVDCASRADAERFIDRDGGALA